MCNTIFEETQYRLDAVVAIVSLRGFQADVSGGIAHVLRACRFGVIMNVRPKPLRRYTDKDSFRPRTSNPNKAVTRTIIPICSGIERHKLWVIDEDQSPGFRNSSGLPTFETHAESQIRTPELQGQEWHTACCVWVHAEL